MFRSRKRVHKLEMTYERLYTVKLPEHEIRTLAAVCEAQGLMHVLRAGSGQPSHAYPWHDVAQALYEALEDA